MDARREVIAKWSVVSLWAISIPALCVFLLALAGVIR
jgi:hypothetical protein